MKPQRLPGAVIALVVATTPLTAQLPVIESFGPADASPLAFGSQPTLSWEVTGATTVTLSPGVGAVPDAGSATVGAPGLVTLIANGETWRYLDTGADLGPSDQPASAAAWFHPDFDDSGWLTGQAPLGYTNDNSSSATPTDQSSDLRYGPVPSDDPLHPNKANDPAAKFATTYFRKSFEVPAGQLAELRALHFSLRRDDAAIAYLNGVEILRHNLPEGSVSPGTFASATAVGGNEFGTFFRVEVPVARLRSGANVLAVEIHQANATSSDIVMDARLEGVIAPGLQTLLPRGAVWKYLDDGSDPGGAWMTAGFNDTSWAQGPGTLGYNNNTNNAAGTAAGANTLASFGLDPNNKPITLWCRKSFVVTDAASLIDFAIAANYDDGMIVYLNGVEIARAHMPSGAVNYDTLAVTHEGDYGLPFLFNDANIVVADPSIIAAALVEGNNLLAVQVHQSAANSSDASFNLALVATDGVADRILIKPFDRWAFLDSGDNLGAYDGSGTNPHPWVTAGFDDSAWERGYAEIGYGDPNDGRAPATSIDYGPDLPLKFISAYFRRSLLLANPSAFPSYTLELYRDDAAAIYINGVEVYRDPHLPEGAAFDTRATTTLNTTSAIVVPSSVFQTGANTLAVEVHQESPTSSDLFFDLAVHGNRPADTRTFTLSATNAAGTVTRDVTLTFAQPPASPVLALTSVSGAVSPEPGWNHPALWRDQLPPTPEKGYAVLGSLARVLATGDGPAHAVFGGGSLTLGPRAILVHNGANGVVATCPQLILAGGEIQSSHNADPGVLQSRTLAGAIEVSAPSTINPSGPNRDLEISATLTGSAPLTVAANGAGEAPNLASRVIISGENSSFGGNWDVFSTGFITATATALGGSAAAPNTLHLHSGALLEPAAPLDAPHTSALLNNTGGNNPARIALTQNVHFRGVTLETTPMAEGTFTFASLSPAEQVHFLDGPGTLTIGGSTASDTDGDSLPDSWETTHFGSLVWSATDDPDADGFNNAAEFKIGTLPNNGASQYRFEGPTVIDVAGTPAIRLAFPAQLNWSIQPQWTSSLTTGLWLNLGPPLTGSTLHSVIDNGTQTGGLPPLSPTAPRRFYRARIVVP